MDFRVLSPPEGRIYFDHNATSPIAQGLGEYVSEALSAWGNPSSIHWGGRGPKGILRDSRRSLAGALNVSPLELVFTSGGSESNNTVLKGFYEYVTIHRESSDKSKQAPPFRLIISQVEHPSVIKTAEYLRSKGARLEYVPVTRSGQLDIEIFQRLLEEPTDLVSIMAANNETGTLFPIPKLAAMAKARGAFFHTDAVQCLGKIPVDLKDWGVDYASFSSHKFYSLKGSGILYLRKGAPQWPLIHGGGQERSRRAGTENALAIGSFGFMAKHLSNLDLFRIQMQELRDYMELKIQAEVSEVSITAGEQPRLPNTSSMVITGVDGESLLMALDVKGFAVSTGAACSSGSPEPSPVLRAMGLSRFEAQSSLRLSLGWENTKEEVDLFVSTLKKVVDRLRSLRKEVRV